MIRKSLIALVAVLGSASLAVAADNTRMVYVGGHEPVRQVRTEVKTQSTAPYALTGNETRKTVQTENIWVGSRFVGARTVEK